MALQLTNELGSGVSGNYWRITKASTDPEVNNSYVTISLYKDQAARNGGKVPMLRNEYEFYGSDNPCTNTALETNSIIKLLYDKLKTLSEWSSATDVLE